MKRPEYYQVHHHHSSSSHRYNKDSPVTYMHYLKEADKLACKGIPQIACTMEHAWQGNYWKIYDDLENMNTQRQSNKPKNPKELEYVEGYKPIKFIFGTEAYWVEDRFSKDSSNNHIVLLAKNDNGRKKLNRAIYESFNTGYYYKNRMDLDILLSLPKDDVFVTSACFESDMMVQTKDGYKKISEVTNKDKVLTHLGKWENVVTPTRRWYKDVMYNLKVEGCFNEIKCTKNHLFPTVQKKHGYVTNKIIWKKAEDLLDDDRILTALEDENEDMENIDVDEILKDYRINSNLGRKNKTPIIKNKILVDDLFLKVLGLYVAEGNTNKESNYLCFTLHKKETNLYNIINEFSLKYVGKKARINDKKGTNAMSVLIHSKELTLLFKHFINEGVINKNVPEFVMTLPHKKQMSFIKGLFLGDGSCASNRRVSYVTISEQLAYQVQSILENNGIKCSCMKKQSYLDKLGVNHRTSYIIEINSVDFNKYWVEFENSDKYYDYNKEHKYSSKKVLEIEGVRYLVKKIKKIETYDYNDYVHCLNVSNIHSFRLEGISVHNCIAYWGKYASIYDGEPDWTKIDEITLKLFNHFTDFYLEVQANNTDKQKLINKHIMELHYKYGIPIISATDSHYINQSQHEDREDLLKSNKISYPEEEGWFLDLPDVDTLIDRFLEQGILTLEEIYEAINNTNVILDFEDIILDRSLKVPVPKKYKHLPLADRNEVFKQILRDEWRAQKEDINEAKFDEYISEIRSGIEEVIGCNMADYFLCNYEIMARGQEEYGGILTPSGRGSGVGFYLNKLLRFTKVDKINSTVLMYPERFLTKERILDSHQAPDIDHNVSDRKPFIQAQKDVIGEQGTFDLIAFGTLKYKSAFKMYSRAYNLDPQLANEVTKQITKYEDALKYADEEDKELIDIFDYVDKEKYEYLIDGCQEYLGIVDNLKGHPCGTICSDLDVIEEIGVIMVKSETTKKETWVAVIESGTIDAFGWLKQDYLIVDSIGLTYEIYREIGMEPMTVNQLLNAIDGDEKTWNIYKQGLTMCVNQCEQPKSTQKVMAYMPQNISELTQFIAGIRPSFKKMYKKFESRVHFDYGIKVFDDLIQDAYCDSSFILYQEHIMKVLGFAHFPMGDTYTIIKAISKKKEYKIKEAKSRFVPQFAKVIMESGQAKDEETALELSNTVWDIIEDSAQYGFNSAHAYCMAVDSVTLAWQKAHYPLEFYKVALQWYTNKGNKDKVAKLKKEMTKRGFVLNPIKFGDDNREFAIDKENNYITQTMSSIKNMQKIVPDIMYELGLNKPSNLFKVFKEIKGTKINKASLDILIKLDYFREYGTIPYIRTQLKIYEEMAIIVERFRTCKQLKKSECEALGIDVADVELCCDTVTPKMLKDIHNDKLMIVFQKYYRRILEDISSKYEYEEIENIDKMSYQAELMGYVDIVDPSIPDDIYIVESKEVNKYGTTFISIYQACSGDEMDSIKVNKKWYNDYPCVEGNILRCAFEDKEKTYMEEDENGKKIWIPTGEFEKTLKCYSIIDTI